MRLIDADALKDAIRTDIMGGLNYERFIDDAPIIDAVPVKHGKWIHGREVSRDYVGDACVCINYENWWCSECKYTVDWGKPLWHYCPNCGFCMD